MSEGVSCSTQDVRYYTSEAMRFRATASQDLDLPNLAALDFGGLAARIAREKALLHPTSDALRASFAAKEAVVALDRATNNPIGYVRLEPTIPSAAIQALGLTSSFPRVVEAGSMFVDPDGAYRGHGHLPRMCQLLLSRYRGELARGELLVLGTAKNVKVFKALDDITGVGGVKFDSMHPHDLKFLAALTCICNGEFGRGYQHGVDACAARIGNEALGDQNLMQRLVNRPRGSGCETRCVMFVSSRSVAHDANQELQRACGGDIGNLIAALRDSGFYGAAAVNSPVGSAV